MYISMKNWKIPKIKTVAVCAVLLGCPTAAVGLVVYLTILLPYQSKQTNSTVVTQFASHKIDLTSYFRIHQNYTDACEQLTLPDAVFCSSTRNTFLLYQEQPEHNNYYCFDHTGFSDVVSQPPVVSALSCR